MLIRYLLYVFLVYLLYRFIVGFLIPVFVTTRQMKRQFQEMHNKMEDYIKQSSSAKASEDQPSKKSNSENNKTDGDYIDFEEVK